MTKLQSKIKSDKNKSFRIKNVDDKKRTYVVTANVWNEQRDWISKPLFKSEADEFAKKVRREMRLSIPKYKWASNIRVEKIDI